VLVEVIIPLALRKNYTWSVPPALEQSIVPGIRVEVSLGKTKHYAGIVKRIILEKPEGLNPKDIIHFLVGMDGFLLHVHRRGSDAGSGSCQPKTE
jgi:primosomal protein N' (replication factor Y)